MIHVRPLRGHRTRAHMMRRALVGLLAAALSCLALAAPSRATATATATAPGRDARPAAMRHHRLVGGNGQLHDGPLQPQRHWRLVLPGGPLPLRPIPGLPAHPQQQVPDVHQELRRPVRQQRRFHQPELQQPRQHAGRAAAGDPAPRDRAGEVRRRGPEDPHSARHLPPHDRRRLLARRHEQPRPPAVGRRHVHGESLPDRVRPGVRRRDLHTG